MKISISYPPIETPKGIPLLAQNRQFQYFNEPTFICPMVPAYAATLLKREGHEVVWDDAIAQGKSHAKWLEDFNKHAPDLVAIEAKTPIIKAYWKTIADIKKHNPKTKVALMGDHVTALPLESFENCPVDFVITGGDYDFSLRGLAKSLETGKPFGKGVYWREKGVIKKEGEPGGSPSRPPPYQNNEQLNNQKATFRSYDAIKNSGPFCISNDLNELPFIDRDLTRWKDYAYKNGNYKRTPGTYTMVGRDCWWGKCTFCSWTTTYKGYRTRTPQSLLDEIGVLIEKYGVKEVFDDTGSFPAGKWLEEFCKGMIERGYNKKIYFSCNMRFGGCTPETYRLMKKANFRFVLFGLESANLETLKRLNKGTTPELCVESCKQCAKAGLYPHVTIMVGYPWEPLEQAKKTVALGRFLLKKGFAHTLQATIPIPYPGTPLFAECKKNGWLLTNDWDDYDMRHPVMKTPYPPEEVKKMVQELYKVAYHPEFVARKLASIRDIDDVKFFARAAKKVVGHLADFGERKQKCDECEKKR